MSFHFELFQMYFINVCWKNICFSKKNVQKERRLKMQYVKQNPSCESLQVEMNKKLIHYNDLNSWNSWGRRSKTTSSLNSKT